MQDIQNKAVQTYQKNIEYFQKKQPKVMQLLNILEQAITNGDYQERYSLEYIDDNFDIQDLQTKQYVYNKKSSHFSDEFTRLVNYNKRTFSIECLPIMQMKKNENEMSDKERGRLGLYPIMNYYTEETFQKGLNNFQEIKKFIFLGIGLGLHIPTIHKKIKAKNYLIIEENLEFFKLSLFTTDYAELATKTNLYFAIATQREEFLKLFESFFHNSSFDNRFIKYTHFGIHSKDRLKDMLYVISTNNFHTFPYRTSLEKLIRPLNYLNTNSNFFTTIDNQKTTIFEDKPILFLAAGPSLEKNIQWIKEHQEYFIVYALTATLKLLYKHNIKPDIVAHIDGFQTSLVHFKDIDTHRFLKDTIAIFTSFVSLEVYHMFKPEQVFMANTQGYIQDGLNIPLNCVGSFSLNILITLHVKELYLLGLDLALNQETGATHISGHFGSKNIDLNNKNKNDFMNMKKDIQTVEGNFTKDILTVSEFYRSIQSINSYIPNVKSTDQSIYNLSEGARFKDITPLHIEDVVLKEKLDKHNILSYIHKTLQSSSQTHLTTEEFSIIKQRVSNLKDIKKILKSYSKKSFIQSKNFLYELTGLYEDLLKTHTKDTENLLFIYQSYFEYMIPLVVDFFNTENLQDTSKHIQKLNSIISQELSNITNIYLNALNAFLAQKPLDTIKAI